MSGRSMWALAGASAAAVAIGVGELVAAMLGSVSIISAVGALVIDLQPPGAKDLVVGIFGEADKLALEIATLLGGLLVGGLLGVAARRNLSLAYAGFAAFAVIAFLTLMRDPVFQPVLAALSVALAAFAGGFALGWLAPDEPELADSADRSDSPEPSERIEPAVPPAGTDRRRFLITSGSVLALGAVLAGLGRFVTAQVPQVRTPISIPRAARPLPAVPAEASLDVPGLTPIIVPNEDFYRIDTRLSTPFLDAESWTLRIHGMVEREVNLTYADLLAMPLVERYVTIACVSNEVGGYLVGNAKWTGVPLLHVLEQAGVRPDASQLVPRAYDGWTAGFPTAHLAGPGAESLIALKMNDEVLPADHGYPLRLIVPGLYGYVSATKWLNDLELTTWDAFDAYWVPRGWAKEAPILTQSRIDVPLRGSTVPAGPTSIAGVAWAPTRGIRRVEVQVDDEPWREAQLSQPLSQAAWVQWKVDWDLQPGARTVRVRATDGTGEVQSAQRTPPAPDGARGYHEVQVSVA